MITEREILDRVSHTKNNRGEFEMKARIWESAWKLDLWEGDLHKAHEEGREEITLPDPLNIVGLAERLVKDRPDINCPPTGDEDDADEYRKARERFLTAAWLQNSRQQRKNIVGHAWWLALVRSRAVFQVKWVEDDIPAPLRGELLPFHISVLDPLKCGFHYGPYFVEYAFYEDELDVLGLKQRFPDFDFEKETQKDAKDVMYGRESEHEDRTTREYIEFWFMHEGHVYSAVLIDEELVEEPKRETKYNRIPLIEALGDDYPVTNEDWRSVSILNPVIDIWQAKSRLVSQIATGLLWYYDPQFIIETDDTTIDLDGFGPGNPPKVLPVGSRVHPVQGTPNLPISDRLLTIYETEEQHSSFPPSMYGTTQGESGYNAQIHQAAARGRVKKFLVNMQMAMEEVNRILLNFVDKASKPVSIWGHDAYQVQGAEYYTIALSKEQVNGNYANRVSLEVDVPSEEIQRDTLMVRLADSKIASRETVRSNLSTEFSEDEEERIFGEDRERAIQEATNAAQAAILQSVAGIEAQRMQLAAQMEMQQQMGPPQTMTQPGMPQAPGSGGPVQPPSMTDGLGSPQSDGQLTPDLLGMDPHTFQMIANNPSLAEQARIADPTVPGNGREP